MHRIQQPPSQVQLIGRVLTDARRWDQSCSTLLEVDWIDGRRHRGRTELVLRPCSTLPLQGWRVQVEGTLRRPPDGQHPLLPGAAQRLAVHGSWSRLTAPRLELLGQTWTPIADLRRRIQARLQQVAGPERGGLLAALVLGSAQVQLPADLRQIFRVAGLSHALAACDSSVVNWFCGIEFRYCCVARHRIRWACCRRGRGTRSAALVQEY